MDNDAQRRAAREVLSRLRERRAALISDMAESTLEGPEWLDLGGAAAGSSRCAGTGEDRSRRAERVQT
jgi:hypothetical protein